MKTRLSPFFDEPLDVAALLVLPTPMSTLKAPSFSVLFNMLARNLENPVIFGSPAEILVFNKHECS